jgi:type III pantothenate kinase
MLIAIDIGNTNVTVGVFKNLAVIHSFKFDTFFLKSKAKTASLFKAQIFPVLGNEGVRPDIYVSSVVPTLNKNIGTVAVSVLKGEAKIVGEDVIVPIINRYRIPKQVGQDRLVNAYAGLKLYGAGLIIVDFGTAITFDVVSKRAEYMGGLITPGLKMMQEALHKKTALLPYVELSRPIEIIGGDTVSSIRAGIVYGVASSCDGIIRRLLEKECKGFKVIATGGDALLIKPYSRFLDRVEEFLILKGLAFIHKSQGIKK